MTTLTAKVNWQGADLNFVATSGTGHTINVDPNNAIGAKPTELLLIGLGSCACVDVVGILKKARQAVENVTCHIEGKRADTIPAVFTDIHLHFVVKGDVKPEQVAKAVKLSADKYCSVSKMLEASVNITHDFVVVA